MRLNKLGTTFLATPIVTVGTKSGGVNAIPFLIADIAAGANLAFTFLISSFVVGVTPYNKPIVTPGTLGTFVGGRTRATSFGRISFFTFFNFIFISA